MRGRVRKHNGNWLVAPFLENRLSELDRRRHAPLWIFQVQLSATGTDDRAVFRRRPERPNGGDHDDAVEQQRLAMAYRFHPEFAVGSGAAVHADVDGNDPLHAKQIHTRSVPDYEISATDVPSAGTDPDLAELADLELDMKCLAELADTSADALVTKLRPLVAGYRAWIKRKTADIDEPGECLADYIDQARDNLDTAASAADRIEAGIDLLASDDIVRRAFGFANRAMYLQRLHTQVAAQRREDPHRGLDDTVARLDAAGSQRWRPFHRVYHGGTPAAAPPRRPGRRRRDRGDDALHAAVAHHPAVRTCCDADLRRWGTAPRRPGHLTSRLSSDQIRPLPDRGPRAHQLRQPGRVVTELGAVGPQHLRVAFWIP